ncbi:MAG: hypothetical protein R3Y54_11865 [Eubacteriales bacterium]
MKMITKVFLAGVMALFILNGVCMLYYNIPRHSLNQNGATDYLWEVDFMYSRGTEGFAKGVTNNEGLNNLFDYEGQTLEVLLMGSSQMEAFNVQQDQNTISLLNEYYQGEKVYNLGVSGHDFYTISANLDRALSRYQPSEYLIIEVGDVEFDKETLRGVIEGSHAEIPSFEPGVIYTLQGIPYLRLLYSQMSSYLNGRQEASVQHNTAVREIESSELEREIDYRDELDHILNKISLSCEAYGVTPIIFYHTKLELTNEATVRTYTDLGKLEVFETLCHENEIVFIDMTDVFIDKYEEEFILPHGFSNTEIGTGHLNKTGHAIIAEELIRVMEDLL